MKITDPDVIKNGEKDLINAVIDDLDLDAVKDVIQQRLALSDLSSRGGEIVVYNNEIAFRLDFDIQLSGSLMFDRQGNYIPESDESDGHEDLVSEEIDPMNINDNLLEEPDLNTPDETLDQQNDDPEPAVEMEHTEGIPEDLPDDLIEDDIDDILKESRDFWEMKQDG